MKKFKFRLEKVLQYRNMIREEKRRALAIRNQELAAARVRLDDLEASAAANKIAGDAIMNVEELYLKGAYSERLKDEIIAQRLTIIEAEKMAEEARQEYITASRDAEALEKLKGQKLAEYQEYVFKEDEKFLDELTTQKGNTLVEK